MSLKVSSNIWRFIFQIIILDVGVISVCQVLCFHGYRQTKDTFREKTGAFRKHLKKNVEFHFMSAPHKVVQGLEEGDSTGEVVCCIFFS